MMLTNEVKRERGFSLGEFALLLSIFGLLTSIALPAYVSYKIQMLNTAEQSDVLNLGLSITEDSPTVTNGSLDSGCETTVQASCPAASSAMSANLPLTTGNKFPGGIEG